MLKLTEFCFASPIYNGNMERVFSQLQNQLTKERKKLCVDQVKEICIVQYSFKNMFHKDCHTYIHGVPALLKNLDPCRSMLVPRNDILKFCYLLFAGAFLR
jgi:hypothetical protein